MKLRKLILSSFLVAALPLWAKSESKQPDSYAYSRGVEAYNEEKYEDALDWFKRELSKHPDNGYAYIYISGLQYGNRKTISCSDSRCRAVLVKISSNQTSLEGG